MTLLRIQVAAVLLVACVGAVQAQYVPAPQAATTNYLVGANYFSGWGGGVAWNRIADHAERTPTLGYYDEGSPEVADWEIKWAVENGVNFFNYCWYRNDENVGQPMTGPADQRRAAGLHDGMLNAAYRDQFHFTINWVNANGRGGVSSASDLLNNLLPYWTETYFKNTSYLKVDNKPVMYVYQPSELIAQLGGVTATRTAVDQMRQSLQQQGFAGLTLIGMEASQASGVVADQIAAGFDAQTHYSNGPWTSNPTQQQIIDQQTALVQAYSAAGPHIAVAGMGRDMRAWASTQSVPLDATTLEHWRLTPTNFETLLSEEKHIMDNHMTPGSLGSKMILLDNWNEWGEGHHIAPHQQSGFDYLKAVRNVFTAQDNTPNYLSPQQQGFGPYDSRYREFFVGDANGVIYNEVFSSGSPGAPVSFHRVDAVAGQGATDGLYWSAQPDVWKANGSRALKEVGNGNACMPFTPADGRIYTLSADIDVTGTDLSKYVAFGFLNGDDVYNDWLTTAEAADRNAVAWWRQYAVYDDVYSYLGPDTNGSSWQGSANSGFNHFSIVLDTTGAHWTVQWYLNDELKRTQSYAVNPTINFVGMGGTAPATVDNFSLTIDPVPEPSSGVMAICICMTALAAYTRRRRK